MAGLTLVWFLSSGSSLVFPIDCYVKPLFQTLGPICSYLIWWIYVVPVPPSLLESEIFGRCPFGIPLFPHPSSSLWLPKSQMKARSVFSERLVYINGKGREKCDEKTVSHKDRRRASLSISVLTVSSLMLFALPCPIAHQLRFLKVSR